MFVGNNWDGTVDVIQSRRAFAKIGRINVVRDKQHRLTAIYLNPLTVPWPAYHADSRSRRAHPFSPPPAAQAPATSDRNGTSVRQVHRGQSRSATNRGGHPEHRSLRQPFEMLCSTAAEIGAAEMRFDHGPRAKRIHSPHAAGDTATS
ncbi:hypothetical protein [Actinoplanes sp. NPDC026619]|uniref:hypothetical protein n=1 Tax=Actinoplanes sp. NPDC026619 TaxID=3155798 RepID=UPI00340B8DF1